MSKLNVKFEKLKTRLANKNEELKVATSQKIDKIMGYSEKREEISKLLEEWNRTLAMTGQPPITDYFKFNVDAETGEVYMQTRIEGESDDIIYLITEKKQSVPYKFLKIPSFIDVIECSSVIYPELTRLVIEGSGEVKRIGNCPKLKGLKIDDTRHLNALFLESENIEELSLGNDRIPYNCLVGVSSSLRKVTFTAKKVSIGEAAIYITYNELNEYINEIVFKNDSVVIGGYLVTIRRVEQSVSLELTIDFSSVKELECMSSLIDMKRIEIGNHVSFKVKTSEENNEIILGVLQKDANIEKIDKISENLYRVVQLSEGE